MASVWQQIVRSRVDILNVSIEENNNISDSFNHVDDSSEVDVKIEFMTIFLLLKYLNWKILYSMVIYAFLTNNILRI